MLKSINQLIASRDGFIGILKHNIKAIIHEKLEDTDEIDANLLKFQDDLIRYAEMNRGAGDGYDGEYEKLVEAINGLRENEQRILEEKGDKEAKRLTINEMLDFLELQSCVLMEYDDKLVRQLVEKTTVNDENLIIGFKSGIEIDAKNQ